MIGGKLLSASAAVQPTFIEDVFSTYLYTGNGSTQTITNGIDLAGEGGLVWTKRRNDVLSHQLFDTLRGVNVQLSTDVTNGNTTVTNRLNSFNVDGFTLGGGASGPNVNGNTYASWTFRKAPRFFDVVTYTGNATNRTIAHDLGVVPGCIIIKRIVGGVGDWYVYHRGNTAAPETDYLVLNSTAATVDDDYWNDTQPTSSVFSLNNKAAVNASGSTYVAYLFAHDPLGPSGDGSDGLIACGLHTQAVTGANELINLGWEPQWVLTKRINGVNDWILVDNMRGFLATGNSSMLRPNLSNAEGLTSTPNVASNGFIFNTTAGEQHIYIAIRRGPMREPTVGTEVFGLSARTGTGANATVTGGQTADAFLVKNRGSAVASLFSSRLTGTGYLVTSTTAAEVAAGTTILQANPWDVMDGVKVGTTSTITNASSNTFINYLFRRAPGFFDVVAYRGTGSTGTKNHNLGVVPEMMIFKNRNDTDPWFVYHQATGNTGYTPLNMTSGFLPASLAFNNTSPTATVFTVGSTLNFSSSFNYIAYLFASLPGISKVGSYTGNGSSQTINCAFTTGARFVLIKRTDTTGDWYVWDTARGIVSGNDPHLSLNTTDAEVTSDDTIDPDSTGFIVNQVAATNVNVNAATYIYLAIA